MFRLVDLWDKKVLFSLNGFFSRHDSILNKIFAEYLIYALPIILIALWFWNNSAKKIVLRAGLAAVIAWPIFASIIGHIINRSRPFSIIGVRELVFHRPDYSFPSDHAAAIFAIAFSFWFSGYKKLATAIFITGIVTSFFRVATAIHFPSDILGGLVLGLLAAYLVDLFDKPLDIFYKLIIRFAGVLRLA